MTEARPQEKEAFDARRFALELRNEIEQNRIKLPTLPNLSLEALLVVNDAGSSMADVARIISKDTSMAARLVRYANSPLYRGISNVTSVKAAITRIGIDAVKHAILSLAMRDVFTTAYRSIQARMEALWQHSVVVATKSALLASRFPHLNKDEAMLAGLIHDVGVIPILIKATADPLLLEDEATLDKLIRALHMSVGKFMLDHWNFDESLVEVAACHDRFDRVPPTAEVDYVDIVMVANVLAHEGSGSSHDRLDRSRIAAFQRIGEELIEQVQQAADAEPGIGNVLH